MQEVIDSKDKEEINNIVLGNMPKIKESTTSLSSLTKHERRTTWKKASPKPQPVKEKKSVHEDYSKDDEPKKKKWNDKRTIKCPLVGDYKKKELTGLLEEEIVGNLDSGYLLGTKCSACKKLLLIK